MLLQQLFHIPQESLCRDDVKLSKGQLRAVSETLSRFEKIVPASLKNWNESNNTAKTYILDENIIVC